MIEPAVGGAVNPMKPLVEPSSRKLPLTSKAEAGAVVPIPTLPLDEMRIRSPSAPAFLVKKTRSPLTLPELTEVVSKVEKLSWPQEPLEPLWFSRSNDGVTPTGDIVAVAVATCRVAVGAAVPIPTLLVGNMTAPVPFPASDKLTLVSEPAATRAGAAEV